MIGFIKSNLLWTQGRYLALSLIAIGLASYFLYMPLLLGIIPFFIFCFYFFRNPTRICPQAKNDKCVIISPSDGKIVDIVHSSQHNLNGYAYRVSIFLSPIDVHVNWLPIDGVIAQVTYHPGTFVPAYVPKSSELNERNDIVIANEHATIMVRQIAGIVARRICCWVNQGDTLKAGDTFGMIKFGSRVDLFLPESVALNVSVGERVYGGRTVMGRLLWR
jgi:phosphatidylserine decarboxylase